MSDNITIQQQIETMMNGIDLPRREIRCYGSQVTVECECLSDCQNWAEVIKKFARVRGIVMDSVYNVNNENTMNNPSAHYVWRVYGVI